MKKTRKKGKNIYNMQSISSVKFLSSYETIHLVIEGFYAALKSWVFGH